MPIQVVQNNLGHASIGTTSGYLTTERDARLAALVRACLVRSPYLVSISEEELLQHFRGETLDIRNKALVYLH